MHSKVSSFVASLSLFCFLFTSGCADKDSLSEALLAMPNDGLSQASWIVSGSVTNANFANGEVLGVDLQGTRYRSVILDDKSFGIELPGNATYALYFTPPISAKKSGFGDSIIVNAAIGSELAAKKAAVFTFHEGNIGFRESLRLPYSETDQIVNLGEVEIKNDRAFSTVNPATFLDFDGDGDVDFEDPDDQNDGQPDGQQKDQDESITICHFNNLGVAEQKVVSISELYDHMDHQDIIGPCANSTVDSIENEASRR